MPNLSINFNQRGFENAVRRSSLQTIKPYVEALKDRIIQLFRDPKTGHVYLTPGRKFYRASAPGEAPAIRTGKLLRSVRESFPDPLTGILTIDADYADFLEKGTSRMAPRPFVRPALRAVSRQFGGGARARFS